MAILAINGGKKIIDTPLAPYSTIGNEEKNAVVKLMKDGILSKFIGAYCDDFYGGPKIQEFETEGTMYNIIEKTNKSCDFHMEDTLKPYNP